MPDTPKTKIDGDELVLDSPPLHQPASQFEAAKKIRVDDETAGRISAAVNSFVDSLVGLETQSPEFERKVRSISRMGSAEIRRSSEASSRFLDRPTAALQQGPLTQGSQVSGALLEDRCVGQRRNGVGHVEDRGQPARERRARGMREVLLLGRPRIS